MIDLWVQVPDWSGLTCLTEALVEQRRASGPSTVCACTLLPDEYNCVRNIETYVKGLLEGDALARSSQVGRVAQYGIRMGAVLLAGERSQQLHTLLASGWLTLNSRCAYRRECECDYIGVQVLLHKMPRSRTARQEALFTLLARLRARPITTCSRDEMSKLCFIQ
jgi:hypothetical protein